MKLINTERRLKNRAIYSKKKILSNPSSSFPNIFKEHSDLIGFYRFMNNTKISTRLWLDSAGQETLKNVQDINSENLVCVHDTTEIDQGAKLLVNKEKLLFHASLLCDQNRALAHGIVGGRFWNNRACTSDAQRWHEQAIEVSKVYKNAVHVMDREADQFELYEQFLNLDLRFVVRVFQNRLLFEDQEKLRDKLISEPIRFSFKAPVRKRSGSPFPRRIHPVRKEGRQAALSVQSLSGIKVVSSNKSKKGEVITLNVVRVFEKKPPLGETPVEWILTTSEPITNLKEVERVVNIYKRRWLIEEFFKGLKTGCGLKNRQFSTPEALANLTVFLSDVVVRILNLRHLKESGVRAEEVLTPTEYRVAVVYGKKKKIRVQGINGIFQVITHLGGHIKSNGPPGWAVLMRGLEELQSMSLGASLVQDLC